MNLEADFVIIGGGIAGVSCAETLSFLTPNKRVILLTESPIVKAIVNLKMITKTLSSFDVVEQNIDTFSNTFPSINIIHDLLTEISSKNNLAVTKGGKKIKYKYLCLCNGAKPKIIPQSQNKDYVLGIRDTDSVEELVKKIGNSKRLALIGNGGIASELVHKVEQIDVDWIIKDKHISATFVDPGAAQFFQSSVNTTENRDSQQVRFKTRMRYDQDSSVGTSNSGAALGPDWYKNITISGLNPAPKNVKIHYGTEIKEIKHNPSLEILLTNGEIISSDLIVSATGVTPRTDFIIDEELKLGPDSGLQIDEQMATSVTDIFAAGDICAPNWGYAQHWFPMRLWTQARQMGCFAAKCMLAKDENREEIQDFCFELFSHSTNLFGYKVVLLGLYNGQKLGTDYEVLIRMTPKVEFIKFVLKDHRLQGAILIGDTDLAETCENLILNQLDLSPYGDDILNPDVDIEDYFD